MAEITIKIADVGNNLMLRLESSEPLPVGGGQGSIAQELGLIGVELIRREFRELTGLELQCQTLH